MAPKNKGKGKAKNKDNADQDDVTSPKLKSANAINVRHILVTSLVGSYFPDERH
jgi:hypothetical protein